METSDLQTIITALNEKKYAQSNGLVPVDKTGLTREEQNVIQTYRPQQALVIYGTLAPGRPNHFVVESINGGWRLGIVRGTLENKGWGAELGYYGFMPAAAEEPVAIAVHVLLSDELSEYWPKLDAFEGPGYRRMLVPFVLDDGTVGVGNIYALQQESP